MRIDIVVPAYNEEMVIAETVREIAAALSSFPHPCRIIVADNGSTDATAAKAEAAGAFVHRVPERGKGAALAYAAARSDADLFAFIDADLSAHPREIERLHALFASEGADIVVGSRLVALDAVHRSPFRTFTSRAFNALRRWFLGISVADTQCGLKLMNARARDLLASCKERGWFLDMEFLARAERAGLSICETPIAWEEFRYEGRKSKLNLVRDGIGALFAMQRIRARLPESARKGNSWLVALAAGLVALHLLSVAGVALFRPDLISAASDQLEYRIIAQQLIEYGTFSIAPAVEGNPDLHRTIGYPLLVAGTYLFDESGVLLIALQQAMLLVSGALMYMVLRRFGTGKGIAVLLAALFLIEPQQWLYSLEAMTETVSVFLVTLILALVCLSPPLRSWLKWLATGVLLGLLVLVKPTLLIFVPFFLLLVVATTEGRVMHRMLRALAIALIALAAMLPWVARNYALVGEPILSVSPAYNLAYGFGTPEEVAFITAGEPLLNDRGEARGVVVEHYTVNAYESLSAVVDRIVEREGIAGIAGKQLAYAPTVWLSLSEAYRMIAGIADARLGNIAALAGFVLGGLAFFLSVAGCLVLLRSRRERIAALAFLGMIAALTLVNVCIAYARTLIPLYPVILIGAGAALTALLAKPAP